MGNSTFRTLHEFLSNSPLSTKISEIVPEPIADQLWREISGEIGSHSYIFLKENHAVVYTESPLWASLAYQKRETLLNAMRKNGLPVETLTIRNQPASHSKHDELTTPKPNLISEKTSELLQETAAQTTSVELQQALFRLSQRLSKA